MTTHHTTTAARSIRPWMRFAFFVALFAVLATAVLTRPLKRLTDFDQSFYLTIAYDLIHHGTFSNGIFDDVDSTRARPQPGMFFAPLYPLVVAGVAALDARFAATLDCTIEANEKHRELASCDTYARSLKIVHAAFLAVGVIAIAAAGEIVCASGAVFFLAGVLATLGVLWEADLFSHLMTESLAFAVYSLFGLTLVWGLTSGRKRAWALAGLAAGLAALARPPYLLLVPLGVFCLGLAALLPPPLAGESRGGGSRGHDAGTGPPPRPSPASGGGRNWRLAWSWRRLLAAVPSAAVFVAAAALVLAPWLGRNMVSLGKAGFTEEYGAVTLVERLAFNDMTAREFALAFPYCVPVVGPPVVHVLFGDDAEHRFEWNKPDSFFSAGRARRNELVAAHGRIDTVIGEVMRAEMARDWWRHILTTLPLFWCGLWVSGLFAVALLPVFGIALVTAVRRRQFMLLFYVTPALVLALAYAVLANHYPRYNLGLIGPIAVATAWMIMDVLRRKAATRTPT